MIAHHYDDVLRLTKKLSKDADLSFCYEADPCGYGLHRLLLKLGHECAVVSPALIPRRAGDRVKTDRRDALMLARLWRAGELTPIWTPDEAQEAMRDLICTRKQAMEALKIAKQQLLSFLLRHGLRYPRSYWIKALGAGSANYGGFLILINRLLLKNYGAICQIEDRIATLDSTIDGAIQSWHFAPLIDALRALRGVNTTIAVTLVAEIGDIARFEKPAPADVLAWVGAKRAFKRQHDLTRASDQNG